MEEMVEIALCSFTLPHFYARLKPGLGFLILLWSVFWGDRSLFVLLILMKFLIIAVSAKCISLLRLRELSTRYTKVQNKINPCKKKFLGKRVFSTWNTNVWVMSERLLLNANSAIFQLYHGENNLIFNEMRMRSALY